MEAGDVRVAGVSGSLREASYNTALLRAAAELAPARVTVEVVSIADLPLYNWDVEQREGYPEPVVRFRSRIAAADALLVASPEYNYSMTGALKNALDWASRPPAPIDDLPAGIMGAGGRLGTARSQAHLRDVLRHNRMKVVAAPEVLVARPAERFDDGLHLVDERARSQIARLMEALVELVDRERSWQATRAGDDSGQ